ncbi:MAG: RluA family pseudouridine synthase [Oscillospiraceae bacterium]
MAQLRFVVPHEWDGQRLDAFLRVGQHLSGTTVKLARRREGGLTLDGRHLRTVDPVCAGGVVMVDTGEECRAYRPCATDVPVVYEEDNLIAFDKPAGMASHPSCGHPYDTLANVFAAHPSTAGLVYRPLGRLDRDTSGLVLSAKHPHAAYDLPGRTEKKYLALLCGRLSEPAGTVDAPIEREGPDAERRCVRPDGRRAVTHYARLLASEGLSLAVLRLETGRTHQIRVHMASLGHPLAGDVLYGGDAALCARHALHCVRAEIRDYFGEGQPLRLTAPLPDALRSALAGWFSDAEIDAALAPFAGESRIEME